MKKTVGILDDDRVFVNLLRGLLEQWFGRENQEFVIDGFVRAEEFESAETIYDLVFMDIVLP